MNVSEFDHPAWFTAVGTLVGYGIILGVLTFVMFLLPYIVFTAV
jgi:hypothetical protein